jgi:hypothetical protein
MEHPQLTPKITKDQKSQILKIAKKFAEISPVVWDRVIEIDGCLTVYGWIARNDRKKDFLLLEIDPMQDYGFQFWTSSAKYSKVFSEGLGLDHSPCQKFGEYFKM